MTGMDIYGGVAWQGTVRAPARWLASLAIVGVIAIHQVLTPMHLEEKPYIGVLFIVGNVLLVVALGLMFSGRYETAGWLLAAAVCAGELLGFVLSRTVGLPMDYHGTWLAETEDYLGLASVLCEAVFLTVAAIRLRPLVSRGR